jgi:hypothetical protein
MRKQHGKNLAEASDAICEICEIKAVKGVEVGVRLEANSIWTDASPRTPNG